MNTTSHNQIQKAFLDLLLPKNDSQKQKIDAFVLHTKFFYEIESIMEASSISQKELAAKIGTSPSYVNQLFKGNKIANLEVLVKIQRALNIEFEINVKNEPKSTLLHFKPTRLVKLDYYTNFRKTSIETFQNKDRNEDADTLKAS